MYYIEEFFTRADIQQIREFMLNGVEGTPDRRTYSERAKSAEEEINNYFNKEYSDDKKREEVMTAVYNYATAIEAVSVEIGMHAGAKLTAQLFHYPTHDNY